MSDTESEDDIAEEVYHWDPHWSVQLPIQIKFLAVGQIIRIQFKLYSCCKSLIGVILLVQVEELEDADDGDESEAPAHCNCPQIGNH